MLDAVSQADVFTYFTIDLAMHSFANDALNGHIFDDVFKREVKGNAVLVILNEFCLFL